MRLDLNFASRDYLLARKVYASLGLGILACAAVFGMLLFLQQRDVARAELLRQQAELQELSLEKAGKKLDEYAATVDASMIKTTYAEANFANSAISRRAFSWTKFLNRFETLVPDGVGITGIKPNFQNLDVDLSGNARNMDSLTLFIEKLTSSKYFEDIPPSFSTSESKVGVGSGEVVQTFTLKIRYIPEPGPGNEGISGGEDD